MVYGTKGGIPSLGASMGMAKSVYTITRYIVHGAVADADVHRETRR